MSYSEFPVPISSNLQVSEYKIYCNTEEKYVSGWSVNKPTTCYNNNSHDVNSNSIQTLQTIKSNTVSIKESDVKEDGRYHVLSFYVEAAPNTRTTIDKIFDYTFSAFNVQYVTVESQLGDVLDISYNPDTLCGVNTQTLLTGSKTINVNSTITNSVIAGYYIKISDGNNTCDLGVCTGVNIEAGTIDVNIAPTFDFLAGSNIYVTYFLLKDIVIGHAAKHNLGDCMIHKPTVFKGTVGRVSYVNNSSDTKKLVIYMEAIM
jgi:hypothetical protein